MSRAYIAGVGRHLPNAAIIFDRFHVIQLANAALEEVRRAEVRAELALKRNRWIWLKDKEKWTKKQIAQHYTLPRMQLKTGRAFRLKEALREIFAMASTKTEAEVQMQAWFRWARRSRLAPFKKIALTLKAYWDGILNCFDSALSNGSVEAINGLMLAAKARARGYRKPRNLTLMVYLIAAKLSHLSASPYTTTYGDIIK
ncbi:MAG: transposase [Paracoccaceae bacterium]|jgi:transposase